MTTSKAVQEHLITHRADYQRGGAIGVRWTPDGPGAVALATAATALGYRFSALEGRAGKGSASRGIFLSPRGWTRNLVVMYHLDAPVHSKRRVHGAVRLMLCRPRFREAGGGTAH